MWSDQICSQVSVFDFRGVLCGSSVQCISINITTETPRVSCSNHTFFNCPFTETKTTPRHKTQKPWPSCFAALKQAVHFSVLCKDLALIPSRAFVRAAVVGWHRGGWQCPSRSAHVGRMCPDLPCPLHCCHQQKPFLLSFQTCADRATPELCSLLSALSRGFH